ncbi:DUF4249 domain-containing protein [Halosquirtibacter laminarini]|uniref:DUF4249 domain-containing protein n=1 Tax=Halosquirtibacter laminarini TaxID=3374600 RepID=A0AC61NPC0_9BACT|nr:DUF4249 domain-containing protein [Prolixibacteraceae bacterium]
MLSRSKPYYALILWLLLFFSCKKDVTSEYITDSPSQIVVECIVSPQKTWNVCIGRTYQFTESVPNIHIPPKDIEEAYIIEDRNKKIPLHYDENAYAFVHNSSPKEGSHYKLVIKRKNNPDVIVEDTVPKQFEVEEVFGNIRTVKFFVESNDSQS